MAVSTQLVFVWIIYGELAEKVEEHEQFELITSLNLSICQSRCPMSVTSSFFLFPHFLACGTKLSCYDIGTKTKSAGGAHSCSLLSPILSLIIFLIFLLLSQRRIHMSLTQRYGHPCPLAEQIPHIGIPLSFGIRGWVSCAGCFLMLSGDSILQEAALRKLSSQKENNESLAEQ